MKSLSWFVILAAPAIYIFGRIANTGILGIGIVLAGVIAGIFLLVQVRDDVGIRRRAKIGITLGSIYLALVVFAFVTLIRLRSSAEKIKAEYEKRESVSEVGAIYERDSKPEQTEDAAPNP